MKEYQFLVKYQISSGKVLYAIMHGFTRELVISNFKATSSNSTIFLGIRKLNTERNPGRFLDQ